MFERLHLVLAGYCVPAAPCRSVAMTDLWLGPLANILAGLACFSIFLQLLILAWKRRDVAFGASYWLLLLSLLACALSCFARIYTFLQGGEAVAAVMRLATALAAVATAGLLWRLLPNMLGLPSTIELRRVNEALRHEMAERLKIEASLLQNRKMDAVGRISGGLAHDFNNILQVISGNLRLIAQKDADDADRLALTDAAQGAVERGVQLTAQLLAFSQEQGFLLDIVPVRDFFAALEDQLRLLLPPRITLEIEGDASTTAILADPTQLEVAILNIVTNAREAMPDGGSLRIALAPYGARGRSDLADGDYLRIMISDTGLGMPPPVASRAFDPFFSTKPAGMGSGLGLAMVYAMARRSGGTATLESRLGQGAAVTLYLKQAAAEAEPLHPADPLPTDRFANVRVMLVDDEAPTRSVVALTLESLDCAVTAAASGSEALALVDHEWPDLFLLDFAMPGMTGADLATRLRTRKPDSRFIFLSGYADHAAIRAAVGKDAIILQKPASRARLAAALARALRGQDTP